jgi:hypothetical protein
MPGALLVVRPALGGLIEVRVSSADSLSPSHPDFIDVRVSHPDFDAALDNASLIETGDDSRIFTGRLHPPGSWSEYALSVGPVSEVRASTGGAFAPFLTEFVGPEEAASLIRQIIVGDADTQIEIEYMLFEREERLFLGTLHGPNGPLVIDWTPREPIDFEGGDWLGDDLWGFGNFMLGYTRGIADSSVSLVDGLSQLGSVVAHLALNYDF